MDSVQKLIELFRKFPTVGSRTAGRFVYYLMKLPKNNVDELISAILEVKNKVKLCGNCFFPFEGENNICNICADQRRNKSILCVIEKENDLISLENTKKYNGLYFILGGTVSSMKNEDLNKLRTEQLKKYVSNNKFTEIIVALNPTPEGRTTSILVETAIKEIKANPLPKITHLARGIPVGGELEYIDEETLESALEGRK